MFQRTHRDKWKTTERSRDTSGRSYSDELKHCIVTPLKLPYPKLVNCFAAVWSDLFCFFIHNYLKDIYSMSNMHFCLPWLLGLCIPVNFYVTEMRKKIKFIGLKVALVNISHSTIHDCVPLLVTPFAFVFKRNESLDYFSRKSFKKYLMKTIDFNKHDQY